MKILQVSRQFYPAIGGIENVVLNLSRAIIQRNHHIDVATLNRVWGDYRRLENLDEVFEMMVYRLPFFGSERYAIAPSVLKFLSDYDLIHLHSSDFFLDYLALTRFLHKKPIVLHTHGLYFHTPFASGIKKAYLHTVTRLALRQVAAVICVSRHDRELLRGIVPEEKIHIIPNGIDTSFLELANSVRDPNLILSVGRLAVNKRYPLLLEAFARVQASMPETRLMIIGKDQGELVNLRTTASRLGIADKVEFVGESSEKTVKRALANASVWASASGYESFGVGLLEAIAAGCVPVVQRLDAFSDFLEDGQNGFFTDFAQPALAAEQLLCGLTLPAYERQWAIQEGQKTARRFGWDQVAAQVEAVYCQVLESENRRDG